MQQQRVALVVALFTSASLLPGAAGIVLGRLCPGGYKDGESVVRGRYYYTCEMGNLRKDGCLDPQNNRVPLNAAWVENTYEMTCYISDDGRLHVKQTGCVIDGKRYGPGETWSEAKFWFTCKRTPDFIVTEVSGCVLEGRRLRENQRAIANRVLYECSIKETGAIGMCAIGCSVGTRDYLVGETWQDDQFTYTCSTNGGCHIEYTGCIQNGRTYQPNEIWTGADGSRYRCDIILGGRTGKVARIY